MKFIGQIKKVDMIHDQSIVNLQIGPNGSLITWTFRGQLALWNLKTCCIINLIETKHKRMPNALNLGFEKGIVSLGGDGVVTHWTNNLQTGSAIIKGEEAFIWASTDSTRTKICCSNVNSNNFVYDICASKIIAKINCSSHFCINAFGADESIFFVDKAGDLFNLYSLSDLRHVGSIGEEPSSIIFDKFKSRFLIGTWTGHVFEVKIDSFLISKMPIQMKRRITHIDVVGNATVVYNDNYEHSIVLDDRVYAPHALLCPDENGFIFFDPNAETKILWKTLSSRSKNTEEFSISYNKQEMFVMEKPLY